MNPSDLETEIETALVFAGDWIPLATLFSELKKHGVLPANATKQPMNRALQALVSRGSILRRMDAATGKPEFCIRNIPSLNNDVMVHVVHLLDSRGRGGATGASGGDNGWMTFDQITASLPASSSMHVPGNMLKPQVARALRYLVKQQESVVAVCSDGKIFYHAKKERLWGN